MGDVSVRWVVERERERASGREGFESEEQGHPLSRVPGERCVCVCVCVCVDGETGGKGALGQQC